LLVMCTKCGRPQSAVTRTCVHCGGALPDVTFAFKNEATAAVAAGLPPPAEPQWHAELGHHRSVGLTEDRISWRRGSQREALALGEVATAELRQRPLFELLAIAVLGAVLAWLLPGLWMRILLAGLIVASVFACFAFRAYVLRLGMKDGRAVKLPLTVAVAGAPRDRMHRIWASLSSELGRRGVKVDAPRP
jgi:hypothetical protein